MHVYVEALLRGERRRHRVCVGREEVGESCVHTHTHKHKESKKETTPLDLGLTLTPQPVGYVS